VRVYTKPKGKLPDYTQPVVLRSGRATVEDFCNAIHKTIVEQFRQAIVYGKSVKHQPQRVGLSHELADEDISKSPNSLCKQFFFLQQGYAHHFQSQLSSDRDIKHS